MTNRIPNYLKLHIEEAADESDLVSLLPEFDRLRTLFPAVTGCQLEISAHASAGDQLTFPWLESQPTHYQVSLQPASSFGQKIKSQDTLDLASTLAELLNKLSQTRHALRCRDAELAAAVPVVSVDEDGQHLAQRLEGVLRGAAEMMQCFGAGLYMLDEATTCLKLRAEHGLAADVSLQPARRLEDAAADIEAMAGHAVVVEDSHAFSHWQVPHRCGAAICVPVASATTILGTLWLFRELPGDFGPSEQHLAEMTAGRLAADLERSVLIQEVRQLRRESAPAADIAPPRKDEPRSVPPLVEGWDVAESSTRERRGGSFCRWRVAADDKLFLSVGATHDQQNLREPTTAFRSAIAAHTQHDLDVGDLFSQVNETLWSSTAQGSQASLFHSALDPTCGVLNYGLTGNVYAYALRPHGWEPLLSESVLLGVDGHLTTEIRSQVLMPGDILLAITSAQAARSPSTTNRMNHVAETLLLNTHIGADELAELASDMFSEQSQDDVTILVAKRNET